MPEINLEYLSGIINRFKKEIVSLETSYGEFIPYKEILLSELTKTPSKFIEHIKYYIDHRTQDLPDVNFNDTFTKITIFNDCRLILWNVPIKESNRSDSQPRQVVRDELRLQKETGDNDNKNKRQRGKVPKDSDQWQLRFTD